MCFILLSSIFLTFISGVLYSFKFLFWLIQRHDINAYLKCNILLVKPTSSNWNGFSSPPIRMGWRVGLYVKDPFGACVNYKLKKEKEKEHTSSLAFFRNSLCSIIWLSFHLFLHCFCLCNNLRSSAMKIIVLWICKCMSFQVSKLMIEDSGIVNGVSLNSYIASTEQSQSIH